MLAGNLGMPTVSSTYDRDRRRAPGSSVSGLELIDYGSVSTLPDEIENPV